MLNVVIVVLAQYGLPLGYIGLLTAFVIRKRKAYFDSHPDC